MCLKNEQDAICPAVPLPRDILQVSPGCPCGLLEVYLMMEQLGRIGVMGVGVG